MIEQFSPAMIEEFLREGRYSYKTDNNGSFYLDGSAFDGTVGKDYPPFELQLHADPTDADDLLLITLIPSLTYPRRAGDGIKTFIADWNEFRPGPKAYAIADGRGPGFDVVGKAAFPLRHGVSRPQLALFINITLAGAQVMLEELTAAVGVPGDVAATGAAQADDFLPPLIETFLRDRDLAYVIHDGAFLTDFGSVEEAGLTVQLFARGADRNVLTVRLWTDVTYPETTRGFVEEFIADWNRTRFWPKLFIDEDGPGQGVDVVGECSYPLLPGIHRKLFDEFIDLAVALGVNVLGEIFGGVQRNGG